MGDTEFVLSYVEYRIVKSIVSTNWLSNRTELFSGIIV